MKQAMTTTRRRGVTLIELVVAILLAAILSLVVGVLLVSSHKHWNALYNRVHRSETVDGFAAHRMFDTVCRKASYRKALLGSGNDSLELYYWDDGSQADTPENYARFYLSGNTLIAEHGKTLSGSWTPDGKRPTRQAVAASNVDRVRFDVQGASVQMILYYTDAALAPSISSSVRHNF